ncbi:hypothetical protein HN587_04970 [Candidatus Woesearchaeota archaeon]|jgi:hypothetical protein|nr:hypothetical protein [Candidatus Woesearchaeota archaeon]
MEETKSQETIEKFKIKTKSVLISRLPRKEGDDFKTVVLKLYDINNPHKTAEFPTKTLEFANNEKVRIRRLNVSYYMEGNDIVINDLEEIYIEKRPKKLLLRGYQVEVEERDE